MSSDEEKVCLYKSQMDNILEAFEKIIRNEKGGCKKARKWLSGYWFNRKKKEPKDPIESWVNRKIMNKIEGWADGFF